MVVAPPTDIPVHPTDAAGEEVPSPPHGTTVPDTSPSDEGTASERAYARNVAGAWFVGIFGMTTIVTLIALLAGGADDIGVGGCIAIGLASGFWLAPLAGVIGIGRWASRWHQH